ncbi:MAG: hypothetical protein GTO02_06365 [Candidatus Dadabacteria bacterium]|nr:hypothetical protein [Candidatus Dadabacteria bacterium]NIQ14025.1 hypothetical protein [Candidatus Dadabacteria bacterium]
MKTELNFREITNLDNFSGIVPIFPLSSVVFFPNTLLPLHIFEQRYKQMLCDALVSEKLIGMVLLKPGWEKDYFGNPEIYEVAGIGRIITSETFDDGKSNIVLYGLKRVEIIETIDLEPYRKARIKILENKNESVESILKEKILYMILAWNEIIKDQKYKININKDLSLGRLTDVLASILISNVFEKQKLLEELNVNKRARKIISFLEDRLKVLEITSRKSNDILSKRNLN